MSQTTETTRPGTESLKAARAAVKEAYRMLCQAAHMLDLAGCELGEGSEEVFTSRDATGLLRDEVCDLLDEVTAHVDRAEGE